MENPEPEHPAEETFAQVLAELKDKHGVSDSEISRRIGTHHSTVSNWAKGSAQPRPAAIRALAAEFSGFPEERLFRSIGKKAPAALTPDRREAVLAVMDRMTEEQQEMFLIQGKAVADSNDL